MAVEGVEGVDSAIAVALDAQFLADLKGLYAPDGCDPRVLVIYEKLVGRLVEEPDSGELFEIGSCKPRSMSQLGQQWELYILECMSSIEARTGKVARNGQQRVQHVHRNVGVLRYTDLNDYAGRPRARIIYDGTGEPCEVTLRDRYGNQTSYSKATFDPGHKSKARAASMEALFEKARRSSVHVSTDPTSLKQQRICRNSATEMMALVFQRLEELKAAEGEHVEEVGEEEGDGEGLPSAAALEGMSAEWVLGYLDKTVLQQQQQQATEAREPGGARGSLVMQPASDDEDEEED